MSEEEGESTESNQERDGRGRFSPKTQTDNHGQSGPTEGDYSKINTILQKQTGMSAEKFVEYQRKLTPRELFNQLSFLADNQASPPIGQKQGLPPNQPFVPMSPGTQKVKLPGRPIGKQSLGRDDKFALHIAFDPKKIFQPQKK